MIPWPSRGAALPDADARLTMANAKQSTSSGAPPGGAKKEAPARAAGQSAAPASVPAPGQRKAGSAGSDQSVSAAARASAASRSRAPRATQATPRRQETPETRPASPPFKRGPVFAPAGSPQTHERPTRTRQGQDPDEEEAPISSVPPSADGITSEPPSCPPPDLGQLLNQEESDAPRASPGEEPVAPPASERPAIPHDAALAYMPGHPTPIPGETEDAFDTD